MVLTSGSVTGERLEVLSLILNSSRRETVTHVLFVSNQHDIRCTYDPLEHF